MTVLIDSSLWVDYFRTRTPAKIKQQTIAFIDSPEAFLCEPVKFEILRASLRNERSRIETTFATVPLLPTPKDLWHRSAALGERCVDAGFIVPAIDLLIAQVCLEHDAEVVTFDAHFAELGRVAPLKVRLLRRD